MESVYRQAFSEVLEVLKYTSQSILDKIPQTFIEFLKENRDKEYIVSVDFSKTDWEDDLKKETQAIIALIYRDYIVTPEKKSELIKEEQQELLKMETEIRKKYNPDNIFKNKEETVVENTNLPIEIKKETFFKKIIKFFKGLFK